MRKIIASAVGAAALAAIPLSLTTAAASAGSGTSQVCTQNSDLGLTHGSCVSLLNNIQNGNDRNGAIFVTVCKFLRQQSPTDFDTNFKNLGDCVSTLIHTSTPSPTVSPTPTASPTPTPMASPSPTPSPTPSPSPTPLV